jgi:WD40 repeat protein
VNSVGFNPTNQEYLVTVSDDSSIKIWRSKALMKECNKTLWEIRDSSNFIL